MLKGSILKKDFKADAPVSLLQPPLKELPGVVLSFEMGFQCRLDYRYWEFSDLREGPLDS